MIVEVNATSPCLIPFQASGFKLVNGSLIPSASVTTYIYVDSTGGVPIYSETWATGLQNGYISVTMGNDTLGNPLNLNWGQTYWLAVDIAGVPIQMVDSYGVFAYRQSFISTQGEIVQLTQLNASLVTQTSRINILNSTINSLNNLSYTQISNNIGNWSQDKPNYATIAYANAISNLTLTQIVANIGNWTLDKSSYALSSWVTGYIGAMNNLSLSEIVSNIGNWTLDKSSYATINYANAINNLSLSQISSNIGNWTLDKPNYVSTSYVNAMNNLSYTQISNNIGNWTLDKPLYTLLTYVNAMNNLSYSQISSNIGNWTLDKPNYATINYANGINNLSLATISNNIGNFSAENSTIVRNGTKTCSSGQTLQNVTGNSSGFYGDCVVASSSSGFQINASIGAYYNKTSTTYTGSLTSGTLVGYLAGNAICNASFLGTHFCTQEEVMETMWHANITTMTTWSGTAWISSGSPKYAPATTPVNDCNGWTSAVAASYLGNYWAFSTTGGGVGATINCGTSIALACCGVG